MIVITPTVCIAVLIAILLAGNRRVRRMKAQKAASRLALANASDILARHQTLYRIITEDAGFSVASLDAGGHPISPAGNMPGPQQAERLIDQVAAWVHRADLPGLRAALADCGPDRQATDALCRTQQEDGRVTWVEVHCRHVPEDGGAMVLLRDVTEQKTRDDHLNEAVDRLERLALHDPLTGLLNRTGFLAAVDRMLTSQPFLAVLLVDLDGFKTMNDALGHATGDAILRHAGDRLANAIGNDATAARLSGDEFAVLLPGDGSDVEMAAAARNILRDVGELAQIAGRPLEIAATIGISVSPRDGRTATALLRAADIALAYGKTAGGSGYRFFEARMGEALEVEAELRNELRDAIATGEIEPYFQPLVNVCDTAITGFEVLARWVHPRKGVLTPDRFLPLVDELGLSTAMFTAQLESVCKTASKWPAHIRLSLNLSPRELQNRALPQAVREILENTGFDGTRLEIEITEDALINDPRLARSVLDGLRILGLTVSLDDFGTGYSSLYHLRELPFDKIKIDKSFTRALGTDSDSARYVAAIIGLCHALDLEMTAEGIEDEATLIRLREMGCTYGQGFLFGRPMPAEEAGRVLLSNGRPALAAE